MADADSENLSDAHAEQPRRAVVTQLAMTPRIGGE